MSASISTAPEASAGTAEMPARTEVFIPRAYSALNTFVKERSASSAAARSLSWPRTTSTGSRPAPAAVPTARRRTLLPPSGRNSLFLPMRLEVPAASTTPAMRPERSSFMDASPLGAQVRGFAAGVHREHLRDDADGDLLGTVGPQVEADRREQLVGLRRAELAQDLLLADARTKQAQVGQRLRRERAEPLAIVLQRMRLDDGEMAPTQA